MSKIRWGILSTANIGVAKVIPAMQQGEFCEVTAISSRSLEKAQEAASQLGIAKAYGSYEELLADPEIDAIYNPLPNHLHVEWSIKALEAGKHVLCEKPIGLTSEEGRELVTAGKKYPELKLMEAFMYRHHPQWKRAKEIVRTGGIGTLRTIQSFFSYGDLDAENYRNDPAAGGGALFDIGCYCISLSRFIYDEEPKEVAGIVEYDTRFEVDKLSTALMNFESGTSQFTCAMQLVPYQRVNIFGSNGRVEIEIPFNAPPDKPCRMWHQHQDDFEEIILDITDQYTIQGDLFAQAILNDTPVPTPIEDAVRNMEVIEAIFEAGRSNKWVSL